MLWFVTTRDKESGGSEFWIVLANTRDEVKAMFEDDYTEILDISDDVTAGLINEYGGLAKLCTQ